MSLLKKIADKFNGTTPPSEGKIRRSVKRMKTAEGRRAYLALLKKHPDIGRLCDKHGNSALYYAAKAGDTDTMTAVMNACNARIFFYDALMAAAHENQRPAFDLLLARGAVVHPDHIEITQDMAICYGEPGPEGERSATQTYAERLGRGLEMLKAAKAQQDAKRAEDEELKKQMGPLVLTDKISVRGPLKLKPSARRGFVTGISS